MVQDLIVESASVNLFVIFLFNRFILLPSFIPSMDMQQHERVRTYVLTGITIGPFLEFVSKYVGYLCMYI
jgi:hypothetical protein